MTDWRRRLMLADQPQEARVFLFVSAFGIVVGIVYWFVSYEHAGTVLLLGFGAATGVFGWRLATTPSARAIRRRAQQRGDEQIPREDAPGGGTADVDRPYLDESGRLPDETVAPFAVGLGLSIAATGTIFGVALVAVGLLPLAWGAWTWLSSARDELHAEAVDDVAGERVVTTREPVAGTPVRGTRTGGR
jgi:hypothetical protein